MLSILLIALSLSMDAFAVSLSAGITIRELKISQAIRGAFFFGLFQFLMPLAGWLLGQGFSSRIRAFDHWIAFALLVFIGGRMLKEAFVGDKAADASEAAQEKAAGHDGPEPGRPGTQAADAAEAAQGKPGDAAGTAKRKAAGDIRNLGTLLTLALATSIDALAAGVSFSILNQGIWGSAACIGGITFLVCLMGFELGIRLRSRIGLLFERAAQITGGLILTGLGVKILLEHLLGN